MAKPLAERLVLGAWYYADYYYYYASDLEEFRGLFRFPLVIYKTKMYIFNYIRNRRSMSWSTFS